jgi:putative transposase
MARPLRIEFPAALYHVTSRGDRREAIYEDDASREAFLDILAETVARYNWICHAYCLMTNHYHLMIETVGTLQRPVVPRQGSSRRVAP